MTDHDPGGKSKPHWSPDSMVEARFSNCRRHRFELSEIWDATKPLVMFQLMNPSVAGIEHSDPTLRRTGTFARAWGYGGQLIGNMHSHRVTDSRLLRSVPDPNHVDNDTALLAMAARADIVVLAFGKPHKSLRRRAAVVTRMLADAGAKLRYLRLLADGTPEHPLYLPGSLVPMEWVR